MTRVITLSSDRPQAGDSRRRSGRGAFGHRPCSA